MDMAFLGDLVINVYTLFLSLMLLFFQERGRKSHSSVAYIRLIGIMAVLVGGSAVRDIVSLSDGNYMFLSKLSNYLIYALDPFSFLFAIKYIDSFVTSEDKEGRTAYINPIMIYAIFNCILVSLDAFLSRRMRFAFFLFWQGVFMIKIITSEDKYGYDIHSLFKAFFPSEDVKVIASADGTYEANEEDKIYNIDVSVSKNDLKKNIYRLLNLETKRELPWGNLTGIRPTRIVMNLIEQNMSDEDIFKYMKDNYYTSDEKIALSLSIAHREKEILKNIDYDNGYSLYIGIPFCPTTCLYCSFTSYPICSYAGIVDDYLACIMKEIDYVAENFKGKTLDTIYVGGKNYCRNGKRLLCCTRCYS